MKTYFFFLVLIYSFRSEAQYFNSGLKGCDSIHNDSLDSLIEFAYKEGVANFPFWPIKNGETVTYEKNPFPQIGKIHTLDYSTEGNRKFGNVFFVKKDGSRKTLRTAAHNFFNLKTGKLYGSLSLVDIEINGEKYNIESIRCGKNKGRELDTLIKDQCEVTLKEDIAEGIEPLELDYDFLKNKSGKDKNYKYDLVGFHGFPEDWHDVLSINHCRYVYSRFKDFDKNHKFANQIFASQCNSSAGMSGAPLIHNGKAVGMVVSAGKPNLDNRVIPPLPVEQLDVFVNSDNEEYFLDKSVSD